MIRKRKTAAGTREERPTRRSAGETPAPPLGKAPLSGRAGVPASDSPAPSSKTDDLLAAAYDELRTLADYYMRREGAPHTLQPTALVHEAYLRLARNPDLQWENRSHLIGIAARAMRQILVNHAKRKQTAKRGGDRTRLPLDTVIEQFEERSGDLLRLNDALETLARLDPRQSRTVELRFFGGMTIDETAEALGVSTSTVERDWRSARAWLRRRLGDDSLSETADHEQPPEAESC